MKCGRIEFDEACIERYWNDREFSCQQKPGARFSKVPKLFGRISGDIILFVSLKQRRLEARNFEVIFIFIPFATYEKTSFTEKANRSFTNGFSGPKSFRDFRETCPWPELLKAWLALTSVNYQRNVWVSIPLNQWLARTILRATGPRLIKRKFAFLLKNCHVDSRFSFFVSLQNKTSFLLCNWKRSVGFWTCLRRRVYFAGCGVDDCRLPFWCAEPDSNAGHGTRQWTGSRACQGKNITSFAKVGSWKSCKI